MNSADCDRAPKVEPVRELRWVGQQVETNAGEKLEKKRDVSRVAIRSAAAFAIQDRTRHEPSCNSARWTGAVKETFAPLQGAEPIDGFAVTGAGQAELKISRRAAEKTEEHHDLLCFSAALREPSPPDLFPSDTR